MEVTGAADICSTLNMMFLYGRDLLPFSSMVILLHAEAPLANSSSGDGDGAGSGSTKIAIEGLATGVWRLAILTDDTSPYAVLRLLPLTDAPSPLAVLLSQPLTEAHANLATLFHPPITLEKLAVAGEC